MLVNDLSNYCCDSLNGTGYYDLNLNSCESCSSISTDINASIEVYSDLWSMCIPLCNKGYTYNGISCIPADCSNNPLAYNYSDNICCSGNNAYYDQVNNSCGNCITGSYSNSNNQCNDTSCPPGYTFNNYYVMCEMDCSGYLFTGNGCCNSLSGAGYYDALHTKKCVSCETPGDIYYPDGSNGYYGTCGNCGENGFMNFQITPPICETAQQYCGNSSDTVIESSGLYLCCNGNGCFIP